MSSSFQRFAAISLSVLISAAVLVVSDAEAKRIGGGGSVGRKSSNVSNRTAAPQETKAPTAGQPGTAAPAAGAATAGAAAKAPAAAAAQSTRSKWMGPLAGLAAGLGLAWLAHSMGFGEGMANIMMIMMLVMVAFVVIRMVMNRGKKAANTGLAPAAAYEAPSAPMPVSEVPASTRSGSMIGSALGAGASSSAQAAQLAAENSSWRIPADMDVDAFLVAAKSNFMKLQSAYDRADLNELHEFTTAEMYKELAQDIVARVGKANHTEVLQLNAALLGVESDVREHLASVRFTGQVREDGNAIETIDEVWNMSKPASGATGWVLAGVQQY